jgi:thiamine-monophosphate kinase
MGEFDLISRYFQRPAAAIGRAHSGVALGIGDDCALLQPAPGMQLAVSSDMLVSGRHFFADADPRSLGHKALAVNLSDLAACGARPLGFTLALALPQADEAWLAAFSEGLFALADAHGCALIGGDTTQGPLNICITVFGEVPPGQSLLRGGAQAGDDIYVSGHLGDAALALLCLQGRLQLPAEALAHARQRLDMPSPRVALGLALRGVATAAADISDGLLGDLGHILKASAVGATVATGDALDLIAIYASGTGAKSIFGLNIPSEVALRCVLAGGDDYELVFTAPPARAGAVLEAARSAGVAVHRVGGIDAAPGLRLTDAHGGAVANTFTAFDHFKT